MSKQMITRRSSCTQIEFETIMIALCGVEIYDFKNRVNRETLL